MPGKCHYCDEFVVEGEECYEDDTKVCTSDCDDYQGYQEEPDRVIGYDELSDDEDEGRALGFIVTPPRTEE
jgi:hypothetical protein